MVFGLPKIHGKEMIPTNQANVEELFDGSFSASFVFIKCQGVSKCSFTLHFFTTM